MYVLTGCVTGSADIGLLTNFPTRGLPKAALVLTKVRPDTSFGRRGLFSECLCPRGQGTFAREVHQKLTIQSTSGLLSV